VTRRFIDLYLDEDVDVLVAELVRARGFSVTTTRDAGQIGNADAGQLAFAARERKALVTHNRRHFESLARLYGGGTTSLWDHPGDATSGP
jgi:hypothetical protein